MATKTSYPRWEQKLASYQTALRRLAEIVAVAKQRPLTDIERDGLIQRFEFTHEMAWKVMMSFCKYQSPETELFGSKDSTRWAFEHNLITDGDIWMEMIAERNFTSHNYNGEVAGAALSKITDVFFPAMVTFCDKMLTYSTEKTLFA